MNDVAHSGAPAHLVLYDGVCGLCDRTVRTLLRLDHQRRLQFAPLQGTTAAALRQRHTEIPNGLESIVYVDASNGDELVYTRSEAAFRICDAIGYRSPLLALARRLPRWLNDLVYSAVVVSRYRLFGKLSVCRIPRPEERERFLP